MLMTIMHQNHLILFDSLSKVSLTYCAQQCADDHTVFEVFHVLCDTHQNLEVHNFQCCVLLYQNNTVVSMST